MNNVILFQTVNVPTNTSIEGTEYYGEEVQDSVCLAVVKQAYLMYKLFHNTFTSSVDSSGNTCYLKEKVESFFNKVITLITTIVVFYLEYTLICSVDSANP